MPKDVTFNANVIASNAEDAFAKVAKRLVPGFRLSGRVQEHSARALLWNVEVVNEGGDVNDCWVVLSSYGILPGSSLNSVWQEVLQ